MPTDKCNRHNRPMSHTMAECRSVNFKRAHESHAQVLRVVHEEVEPDDLDSHSRSTLKNLTDDCDVRTLVVCNEGILSDNIRSVSQPKHVFIDFGVGPKDFILDTGSDLTIIRPEYLN